MGFLDNDTIVVDAILTKYGRKLLHEGQAINPTHFALSDDGIDYTLWNSNSTSGSSGYDDYITKLPLLEAVPDDSVVMRYTLYTLPQNTRYLPAISFNNAPNAENNWTLDNDVVVGETAKLEPVITNYAAEGPQRFDFQFMDATGLTFVDIGGGTRQRISGNNMRAQESKTPEAVTILGATHVEVSDITVISDITCNVFVKHQTTGAVAGADITVLAAD